MSLPDPEYQLFRGMTKLKEGDCLGAMVHFDKAVQAGGAPLVCSSYFGYCIAKERGQVSKGLTLCTQALDEEPDNPVHYLNMARIHLLANNREKALEVLRKGASCGANEEIADLLEKIGTRKPPPLSFLHRDHPINKYLGIFLGWLGQR